MKPAKPHSLAVYGGSSSIKFALFETDNSLRRIWGGFSGLACRRGLTIKRLEPGRQLFAYCAGAELRCGGRYLIDWIEDGNWRDTMTAVEHRI